MNVNCQIGETGVDVVKRCEVVVNLSVFEKDVLKSCGKCPGSDFITRHEERGTNTLTHNTLFSVSLSVVLVMQRRKPSGS